VSSRLTIFKAELEINITAFLTNFQDIWVGNVASEVP
jgi:hypothetical protein